MRYEMRLCPSCGNPISMSVASGDLICNDCGWQSDKMEDSLYSGTSSSMDLRDQFAVEAMKVLLKNDRPLYEIARTAYILADFMMKRHIESAESAVEPNTEVIDPCDYDQGSSMYLNCGDCIIKGCMRDAKHPPKFGEGKECIPIKECDAADIECKTCAACRKLMYRDFMRMNGR